MITQNPFDSPEMRKATKGLINKEVSEAEFKKISTAAADKLGSGMSISDALDTLTYKDKGETSITVNRPGQSAPVVLQKVALGITKVDPVSSKMLGHGIMYIHVSQFNSQAATDFAATLDAAMKSANQAQEHCSRSP